MAMDAKMRSFCAWIGSNEPKPEHTGNHETDPLHPGTHGHVLHCSRCDALSGMVLLDVTTCRCSMPIMHCLWE